MMREGKAGNQREEMGNSWRSIVWSSGMRIREQRVAPLAGIDMLSVKKRQLFLPSEKPENER
jgi:hypothetical protein